MNEEEAFLLFIVRALVNSPQDVEVARTVDEKGILLELTVAPEDIGRIIGKRGVTAQALRTLLWALASRNEARYSLKIVDHKKTDNLEGATE